MLADPRSKLAEWFKPGTLKPIATDKVRLSLFLLFFFPVTGSQLSAGGGKRAPEYVSFSPYSRAETITWTEMPRRSVTFLHIYA